MKKRTKTILLSLLALLAVIQFFQIDKTNPPVVTEKDFVFLEHPTAEMAKLLHDACYDCHSHTTEYPWYTNIQPVAWWIKGHIKEAREHLNFSTWGDANLKKKTHQIEELEEMVGEGEMPLKSFTWTHPEARLTSTQRKMLVSWFKELGAQTKKRVNTPPQLIEQGQGEVQ